MKAKDLVGHQAALKKRLDGVEEEKAKIIRELQAIDVLLEGIKHYSRPSVRATRNKGRSVPVSLSKKPNIPPHAVRVSPRSSLIGAVEAVARRQSGSFDSVQLLRALQRDYPEFNVGETKHISSQLSDLVKRGVLILERKRQGNTPNLYKVT